MEFISSIHTDIGIRKKVNQDAAVVKHVKSDKGDILFAMVCDGMGGLEQGEIASSSIICRLTDWFENKFPMILYNDFSYTKLKDNLREEINNLNIIIKNHGNRMHIQLGTTLTMLLIVDDHYYLCNIGDSRIYYLKDDIVQLTHDQSYVQNEVDMGRMSEEEAANSPKKNILLQCIGVGEVVPDFYVGRYEEKSAFLLCSDGFRHVLSNEEIFNALKPNELTDQQDIRQRLKNLTETVTQRKEEDNITSILVYAM